MTGFEGWGDFDSDDPWERYVAHQAAKGNLFNVIENPSYGPGNPDWEHDREREDHDEDDR